MTKKLVSWANLRGNKTNLKHYLLSNLSLVVRGEQYDIFEKKCKPTLKDKIIDVGVSSVEVLPDTNFFEKKYPFKNKLTVASIDDPLDFIKKYPDLRYIKITEDKPLPFEDKTFDIAVSWATLEHVGSKNKQEKFLKEMFRVGKKVFITVPYRGCIYEPHSELFFVHWLPRKLFAVICKHLKKDFWGSEENLRSLWTREVKEILPKDSKIIIKIFYTLKIFPSHILIIKE